MAQDFEALGRYTDAEDRLKRAVTERHNSANRLDSLVRNVTGQSITGNYVKMFDVQAAQEIINKMSKLEDEINSAVSEMNAYAAKCGKPTIQKN